jgi:hypothetical protein
MKEFIRGTIAFFGLCATMIIAVILFHDLNNITATLLFGIIISPVLEEIMRKNGGRWYTSFLIVFEILLYSYAIFESPITIFWGEGAQVIVFFVLVLSRAAHLMFHDVLFTKGIVSAVIVHSSLNAATIIYVLWVSPMLLSGGSSGIMFWNILTTGCGYITTTLIYFMIRGGGLEKSLI